jgi:endoglucanase
MQETTNVQPLKFLFVFLIFIAAPAKADNLPRLQVVGNHLETPDGKSVHLRGVSLCSLDWQNPQEQLNDIAAGWKANVVRLPVQPKEWVKSEPLKYVTEKLDPAVKLCNKHGFYCIIDWHRISDWTDEDKDKKLEEFWSIVAPRYATNPNILYEVYNEPTGPKKRDRDNWLAFRPKMQGWINQIKEFAPHTVLLIGSPSWSQMPAFAVEDPLEGSNLVYVMHAYPGNFKPSSWDKAFGNASNTIPVFMSEWGWSTSEKAFHIIQGSEETFGQPMKDYLNARPQIGWTAWSYDPKCGPAMLGNDSEMGVFVKKWLEELASPAN